jgi:hypothetical protein
MLLKSGAGPNIKTDDGQTPVHVAAKHGNLITLMLLMDDGGDPLCKSKVMISLLVHYWIICIFCCFYGLHNLLHFSHRSAIFR